MLLTRATGAAKAQALMADYDIRARRFNADGTLSSERVPDWFRAVAAQGLVDGDGAQSLTASRPVV